VEEKMFAFKGAEKTPFDISRSLNLADAHGKVVAQVRMHKVTKVKRQIARLTAVFIILGLALRAPATAETSADRDARMEWWRKARLGMFVHWGLYAIPAGEWQGKEIDGIGEWIMSTANIPIDEYEQLGRYCRRRVEPAIPKISSPK
jgi:hypothetical protein